MPLIEPTQVSKIYQTGKTRITALRECNFKVDPGDFLIIRGPSGSGKSTLLNILGLLDEPTSGAVYLKGKAVTYEDYDRLAILRSRTLSFIFQAFHLNPVLTLEENVMVPLMIRSDLQRSEKNRRVGEWIEKTGLEEHKHHRPDELSGGQRQRVAIARAMVSEPELIIADEPTANLDSHTSRNILSLMRDLNREKQTAFVFATHDPVLDEFSKKVLVIKDGQMVP
jgi:putative ABC transport system ATP-binding protein